MRQTLYYLEVSRRSRILVPVFAAILVVAGLLALVWWQLTQSQNKFLAQLRNPGTEQTSSQDGFTEDAQSDPDPVIDAGDIVLLHLRQGDLLSVQGEWALAEAEYQIAVDHDGGLPALRKLAQAQLQRRNIPAARATIERLKAGGARREDLLLMEVIVALRTGEVVQAETQLNDAAESPQKHYGLALVAIIKADHATAKTELAAVVSGWDPTLRAYARTLQGAYEEFALFPESSPVHLQTLLARALAQAQECELALPLLSQVLEQKQDYRDAWMVQGYCELTSERTQQAIASFDKAYELDPEKPEIQYFLGRAHLALKDWKSAATFLSYALENGFTPEKEARRHLATAAMELNDAPLAIEQLTILLSLPDADYGIADSLVSILLAQNRTADAYDIARTAMTRWPEDARAYDLFAKAALASDKKDEARTALEKALQLDPTLQSARERYGSL